MKNSVLNNQKEEADQFLEKFKKENREMLQDRDVVEDFINFTVPQKNSKKFIR